MKNRPSSRIALAGLLFCLGCASDVPGLDPHADQIRYPIGLQVLPGDRHLLVVNSNFDLQFNAATAVVVDLHDHTILPQHSIRLNSFTGDVVLRKNGTRAYVTSRLDGQINVLDIDQSATPMLKCTSDPTEPGKLPRCSDPWVVSVASNPFGLFLQEAGSVPLGCSGQTTLLAETLVVAHLNTATITTAATGVISTLDATGSSLPLRLTNTFIAPGGVNGIAQHPGTGTLYVTSRFDSVISMLRVLPKEISSLGSLVVTGARQGIDHRGIVFNPEGSRAYVAYRSTQTSAGVSDPMLAVFNTSCSFEGREENRLVTVMDLCSEPGQVRYVRRANQPDRIYVPCGGNKQLFVFDPELLLLESIIDVGDGAYNMTFTAGVTSGSGLQRAYVGNFREDSISVIELDPRSPNFHREIARIRENPRILP